MSLFHHTWRLSLWLIGMLCVSLNAHAKPLRLLLLGDSLSAGYQMSEAQAWPSLLEKQFDTNVNALQLINASISGETTQGGLNRLSQLLEKHQPDALLIELGGNDGLRGLPIKIMQNNLNKMINLAKQQEIDVALMQIRIPANYGPRYVNAFESSFAEIAKEQKIRLLPFLAEEVALDPRLMLSDGIHPNKQAQSLIAEKMFEPIEAWLFP